MCIRRTRFGNITGYGRNLTLFLGPDRCTLAVSVLLILVPGIVAVLFVTPLVHVSATLGLVLLMLLSLGSLLRTGMMDPGIIPRRSHEEVAEDPIDRHNNPDEEVEIEVVRSGVSRKHRVFRRWCYTCRVQRPPRASHCTWCDCCIDRLDHHCPWTGTCVGARNYAAFFTFLSSTTVLTVYVVAVAIAGMALQHRRDVDQAATESTADGSSSGSDMAGNDRHGFFDGKFEHTLLPLGIAFYALLLLCCVGGLCFSHTGLIVSGMTTREELKQRYGAESPFDEGCTRNARHMLCTSTPSLVHPPQGDDEDAANDPRTLTPIPVAKPHLSTTVHSTTPPPDDLPLTGGD